MITALKEIPFRLRFRASSSEQGLLYRDQPSSLIADFIAIIVILLMAIGTVFVFSASANISYEFELQRFYDYPGLRQIMFFPLACLIMYLTSHANYRRLSFDKGCFKNPVSYFLIISIILLIIILMQRFFSIFPPDGFVPMKHNRYRWIHIPLGAYTASFQPSELAKWTIIFFLAGICDKFGEDIKQFWKRFMPICMLIGVVVALIILEDFGTAAFIALLAFLMLIIAGVKWWHILTPLPFGAAGFLFILISSPGRIVRIKAFLNPEQWADSSYQANQSLIAIGSGGLWGKGLGRGICKYGHLPEDTTDFIFAIIGEELGFAGNAAVILLFILFIVLGVLVIILCQDRLGQLLASGIVLAIAIQAALNIGVVTVVLPTKGIPLPFVSAGGTSMLLSAAAVGVLLNIAKQSSSQNNLL
jgi:cell division protein FtsW